MATFLMIHGSWHGGWCFEPLRASVEERGHTLIAPTLPGMDGRNVSERAITLDLWTEFILDIVGRQDRPVILCGHSRGGIVASSVAERAPDAIQALVYISAFLLPSGQSVRSFQAAAPNPRFDGVLTPSADGTAVHLDSSAAASLFYHRAPRDIAAAASERLVPEPALPRTTRLALTDARFGSVRRHYVECSDDRAILPVQQRMMQADLPCLSVLTLDSDHSPFFCCPQNLVSALELIAN